MPLVKPGAADAQDAGVRLGCDCLSQVQLMLMLGCDCRSQIQLMLKMAGMRGSSGAIA